MASAYGVEPLVKRLVEVGADVNTRNGLSWTPLQEACHRGYLSIMKHLVKGGADVNCIPDETLCRSSPFLRAPAQSPLGEVCRCGFKEAVKFLLDNGANKDLQNSLGWTPLHEASFFNQVEIVQMLLVYGANATIRNNQGALPYHLASLPDLKRIIKVRILPTYPPAKPTEPAPHAARLVSYRSWAARTRRPTPSCRSAAGAPRGPRPPPRCRRAPRPSPPPRTRRRRASRARARAPPGSSSSSSSSSSSRRRGPSWPRGRTRRRGTSSCTAGGCWATSPRSTRRTQGPSTIEVSRLVLYVAVGIVCMCRGQSALLTHPPTSCADSRGSRFEVSEEMRRERRKM
jgi:hypothetical protein